jgi:hypothetical protein
MIKIIEKTMKEFADKQINLQSDTARTMIATTIAKAVAQHQQIKKDLTQIVPEQNIDDVITTAMKNNGYTKGDSGYDMRSGKRDITFHTEDDQQFEVTFRRLNNE